MSSSQRGSVLLLLLLGVFVFSLGFGMVYYFQKSSVSKDKSNKPSNNIVSQIKNNFPVLAADKESVQKIISSTPTPEILLKTYTNAQYKFQLIYPAQGMIWGSDGYTEGECGNNIEEKDDYQGHYVYFDNLVDIRAKKWSGTIDDYLASIWAAKKYDLEKIENSGAEEAVKVVGLKKDAEYAVGFPPLIYVNYIYKKGDNLFLLSAFQTPSVHPKGCTNPVVLDPVAHSHLKVKDWDIAKSFKFITK